MQETWDMSSIPGLGRSPGGGHGNLLQYSCLENPMDRDAWFATVHRVEKSWTRLKQLSTHSTFYKYVCVYKYTHTHTHTHTHTWIYKHTHIYIFFYRYFSLLDYSVQLFSHVWLFETPWTAACQASLCITNSWSLLKLVSIELVMPSNHLILCRPLLLLPSIFPSIRVFSNESALHIRWPKYWSFSLSISPSNEYSGLISSGMDWLDLPEVQGTLKSLFQHQSSKASLFRCSAFFIVQLSHPYMITGKTIALTRPIFVGK